MSQREAKALYMMMLSNDEINIMLPNATGEWESDKVEFMRAYEKNQSVLRSVNLKHISLDSIEDVDSDIEDFELF